MYCTRLFIQSRNARIVFAAESGVRIAESLLCLLHGGVHKWNTECGRKNAHRLGHPLMRSFLLISPTLPTHEKSEKMMKNVVRTVIVELITAVAVAPAAPQNVRSTPVV